jgi:hypothetical protein
MALNDDPIDAGDVSFPVQIVHSNGAETEPQTRTNGAANAPQTRTFIPTPKPRPKENNPPQETTDGTENVDAFIPDDPHTDWLTEVANFLSLWNDSPATSHTSNMPYPIEAKFRECWSDPEWREMAPRAIARLATVPTWHGRKLSLKQFLEPLFVSDLLAGVHDARPAGGKQSAKPATPTPSTVPAKPPKTALDRVTFEMLPNPRAMVKWWLEACDEGICESTEVERLNIVGAGVRARMGDIRDGVKWFVSCVRERAWDRIGDEADEIARIRLKELDHGGPERPRGEQIAEILNKLRGVAVAAVVPDNPEVEHAD